MQIVSFSFAFVQGGGGALLPTQVESGAVTLTMFASIQVTGLRDDASAHSGLLRHLQARRGQKMLENSVVEAGRFDSAQKELLEITWRMLNAIHIGDAATYASLSRNDLTCYEDVCAYRIDGVEFHLTLIRQMAQNANLKPTRFDILSPSVQIYNGQTGIVTYTRLMTYDDNGKPRWTTFNETRVFIRQDEQWKMAHFHRSPT